MTKRNHTYSLTLEYVSDKNGDAVSQDELSLTFENHDNLFEIITRMKNSDLFQNQNEAVEMAVGMKMFSEVMLRNRKHPLFEEMLPAFGDFMKKLKESVAK